MTKRTLTDRLWGEKGAERRISAIAAAILLVMVLATGAVIFSMFARQLHGERETGLERTLGDKAALIHDEIDDAGGRAAANIAKRFLLVRLLQEISAGTAPPETATTLGAILDNAMQEHALSGIELYDTSGRRVAARGAFPPEGFDLPLRHPDGAMLHWHGGPYFSLVRDIYHEGTWVGTIRLEKPLPLMAQVFRDYRGLGETGESVLCSALSEERMRCLPSRHSPEPFESARHIEGAPVPLSLALEGKSGVAVARDYRGQEVLDAYRPVGDSGLGMVVKIDTAELERPVRAHLRWIAPFLAALVLAGFALLRWQVGPLVREVVSARERLHAILDNSEDGLVTIDEKGAIESFNFAAARIFGHTAAEMLGRDVALLMPEADRSRHKAGLQRYLDTGQPHIIGHGAHELTGLRKDGSTFPMELTLGEMKLDSQRFFIASIRDTSVLKQTHDELKASFAALQETTRKLEAAQNQLLQSEKMASIGQLAAGVAHEINNPIGYVASNLGTLEKYIDDLFAVLTLFEAAENELPEHSPSLARIRAHKDTLDLPFLKEDIPALLAESREGIVRVKKIVQDLKDFSHVDEAEWQWSDLHKGLDSTLNIVWNELKYKVEVVKEYGDLPDVECIPFQLNQVFMNLLVNAGHAIEERGTITLRTGRQGDEVWVEVADSGKGIAPENLTRIFDPFFTTKPVGKGTGLGLSLSYGIVKKHHGRIEVDSEPGKGATFRVWLPVKQAETET